MQVRRLVRLAVGPLCLLLTATAAPADAAIAAYHLPGGYGYRDGNPASSNEDHSCTIGFNVDNSSGHRVSITAGHCGPVGETEYVDGYNAYGTINRRVFGSGGDYAVIGKLSYSQYSLPPRVISAKKAGETLRVRSAKAPAVGDVVCWTGSTSSVTHCGDIYKVGVASTYDNHTVDNTFRIHGCAHRGDSGGPVFLIRHDSVKNVDYAVAVGIVVALSLPDDACDSKDIVVAQPILPILRNYNLTMP
jgi:hypothetical protein